MTFESEIKGYQRELDETVHEYNRLILLAGIEKALATVLAAAGGINAYDMFPTWISEMEALIRELRGQSETISEPSPEIFYRLIATMLLIYLSSILFSSEKSRTITAEGYHRHANRLRRIIFEKTHPQ